jgi:hypothetical protein
MADYKILSVTDTRDGKDHFQVSGPSGIFDVAFSVRWGIREGTPYRAFFEMVLERPMTSKELRGFDPAEVIGKEFSTSAFVTEPPNFVYYGSSFKPKGIVGKKVWVLSGVSESSDHFGPLVFAEKPSEERQKQIAFSWDGNEDEDGPGDFGSYVYLELEEAVIE